MIRGMWINGEGPEALRLTRPGRILICILIYRHYYLIIPLFPDRLVSHSPSASLPFPGIGAKFIPLSPRQAGTAGTLLTLASCALCKFVAEGFCTGYSIRFQAPFLLQFPMHYVYIGTHFQFF